MRMIDLFDRGASLYPHRAFLKSEDLVRTYSQSQEASCRVAKALHESGLRAGAHVAVYSGNDPIAFECMLGVWRAGRVWVPLNPRNSVEDNAKMAQAFDVEALFFHSAYEQQVQELVRSGCDIRLLVCVDKPAAGAPHLEAWLQGHGLEAPDLPYRPDDVVAIAGTGGTTGVPKGVVLTNLSFATMTANFFAAMPTDEPPVHLVAAPITHGAGTLIMMMSAAGATHLLMKQADPVRILETIAREKVTTLYLPPTVIYMLLAHPRVRDFDYSSLKYFIYAAAPMAVEKLREAIDVFGPVMTQLYGQTEAPSICTCLLPHEHEPDDPVRARRLQSCGRPAMFTQVEIMDDQGNLLPVGQRGEVVVRGNLVMKGYYRNAEATAEASAFGWHHTGDVGVKDEDGYLYIVDRKKDMIISGGFNVFPSEVEQILWAHPAVQDCAVIGVPDAKWGEAVKAIIELKPGLTASQEELLALCKSRLGAVKAPKSVEFWARLPRTPVGKVSKKDIRASFWTRQERKI